MGRKTKILGVAPYEGLSLLMNQIADKRDDIDLHVVYGNLEQAVDLVRNLDIDYDVIISRARTADLILANAFIPVIDIGISHYDVLRCIKQAENSGNKFAIVGFHALTNIARLICELMQDDIKIFPVSTQDNVEMVLREIKSQGYTAIICDTQSYTKSKRLGITPILLTSGEDSVNEAIDKAIRQFQIQQQQLATIDMLKNMTELDAGLCMAFDDRGALLYSSSALWQKDALIEAVRGEWSRRVGQREEFFFLQKDGTNYQVTMKHFIGVATAYTLFRLSPTSVPQALTKNGIAIMDKKRADHNFINSFYSYSKLSYQLMSNIEKINETSGTVMLIGEIGTGKDRIAELIYTQSKQSCSPLYVINCSLVNEKNWEFLTSHHNSPFTDRGNTIYLSNLQGLTSPRQKQLLALISDTNLHVRNRMIFSFSHSHDAPVPHVAMRFVNMTSSNTIHIPALRESKEDIASSASLYLDALNQQLVKQVVGFEKDAMELLKQYHWPCNRTQFKRVLKEIITRTPTAYVSADIVYSVLKQENRFAHSGSSVVDGGSADQGTSLNLDRTFEEINQEIAALVVEKCGGNQTAAARQLGISRTTLWRLLSK